MRYFPYFQKEISQNPCSWTKSERNDFVAKLKKFALKDSLDLPKTPISLYEVLEWAVIWHTGERERFHPTSEPWSHYGKVFEQNWAKRRLPKNVPSDYDTAPLIALISHCLEADFGKDKNGYPLTLTSFYYNNGQFYDDGI